MERATFRLSLHGPTSKTLFAASVRFVHTQRLLTGLPDSTGAARQDSNGRDEEEPLRLLPAPSRRSRLFELAGFNDGRDRNWVGHHGPGDGSPGGRHRPNLGPYASVFDLDPTICDPSSSKLRGLPGVRDARAQPACFRSHDLRWLRADCDQPGRHAAGNYQHGLAVLPATSKTQSTMRLPDCISKVGKDDRLTCPYTSDLFSAIPVPFDGRTSALT
jgi:hypothetical protein